MLVLCTELGSSWGDLTGFQKPEHSSATKDGKFEKSRLVPGLGVTLSVFLGVAHRVQGCYSWKRAVTLTAQGLVLCWAKPVLEGPAVSIAACPPRASVSHML